MLVAKELVSALLVTTAILAICIATTLSSIPWLLFRQCIDSDGIKMLDWVVDPDSKFIQVLRFLLCGPILVGTGLALTVRRNYWVIIVWSLTSVLGAALELNNYWAAAFFVVFGVYAVLMNHWLDSSSIKKAASLDVKLRDEISGSPGSLANALSVAESLLKIGEKEREVSPFKDQAIDIYREVISAQQKLIRW